MLRSTFAPPRLVRLLVTSAAVPERMWGELLEPNRLRVLDVALFADVAIGDVLPVEPVRGGEYADGQEHYAPTGERLERVSRRVVAHTSGKSRRRMWEVVDYLTTWETDDGSDYATPAPGVVFARMLVSGHMVGLAAVSHVERGNTRWAIAFPLSAPDGRIHEFLDGVPYLAGHGLEPEDE